MRRFRISVQIVRFRLGAPLDDAPGRDRGHQERDQHIVAGQRQAEKPPLHLVAAHHLHGVETLQQVAGAAEIADRAGAFGRPLPEPPFDAGVIGGEPGIAERRQREDGEARSERGARRIPRRGERDQRAKRDHQIIGIALLEAERTGADIQHQLEEPRPRQRRGRDRRDRERRRQRRVAVAARMRGVCDGVRRHDHLLCESVLTRGPAAVEAGAITVECFVSSMTRVECDPSPSALSPARKRTRPG